MSQQDEAWLRHQQQRWLRPDAHRWVRPDAARYLQPGTSVDDVFPQLSLKYSQSQPRVPAGSGRESGRWTDGSGGGQRPRVIIDTTNLDANAEGDGSGTTASPSAFDMGDVSSEIGSLGLFDIKPRERSAGDVQLAVDPPPPDDPPPQIPAERPQTSELRTYYQRAIAEWLVRNPNLASVFLTGVMNTANWIKDHEVSIQAARDPAKTFDELREGVGKKHPGYEDHHIDERSLMARLGLTRDEINTSDNVVSIPILKHYQITGWYSSPNAEFGGLSPRQYLSDKGKEQRRQVGLEALILFKVLKP